MFRMMILKQLAAFNSQIRLGTFHGIKITLKTLHHVKLNVPIYISKSGQAYSYMCDVGANNLKL